MMFISGQALSIARSEVEDIFIRISFIVGMNGKTVEQVKTGRLI
jgi:hypothetical protein